jgi:hypothetical protein
MSQNNRATLERRQRTEDGTSSHLHAGFQHIVYSKGPITYLYRCGISPDECPLTVSRSLTKARSLKNLKVLHHANSALDT